MPKPPAFTGSVPEKYERYLGSWIFEPYALDLVARIDPSGITAVLELACGTGRVTGHLHKKLLPGTKLVATDLNTDMIAVAQTMVPDKTIDWQTADAQALAFADASFDLVVCQFGFMFVSDKQQALAEVYRVLRPGGRLLFNTWDKLENNPPFHIADQVVSDSFPDDPPLFFHIPFSLHGEGVLGTLLQKAGFGNRRISLVKKGCTNTSAADAARGMLEGTPVFAAIRDRNPGLLPTMLQTLETTLAMQFGAKPLVSPMQAWVVEAIK